MPAPFVNELCGFREGRTNTSDKSDRFSIDLGNVFFQVLGISEDAGAPASVDKLMTQKMVDDLSIQLRHHAPHLVVSPERSLGTFEQYAHIQAVRDLLDDLERDHTTSLHALAAHVEFLPLSSQELDALNRLVESVETEQYEAERKRRRLMEILGEESLLKLDVAAHRESLHPTSTTDHLVAGFSLKWSLRTDRAQDCRTQGAKMAALRRGRMPHFAAVTMEPRPYFLAILGRGSGDVDCVYHLHLEALAEAIDYTCRTPKRLEARNTFRILREQGRIRDYDELVAYLATL